MPEVEDLVGEMAQAYPHHVYRQNYSPGLDKFHTDLMRLAYERILSTIIDEQGLDSLNAYHSYYCNGSSEALFHLLARHKTHFPQVPLYQFEGEYQGYNEYAKTLGMEFHSVPFGQNVKSLPPGVFFLSVPSAIDGNNVGQSVIEQITERHYVVFDAAYAGMAEAKELLHINNRVAAVVTSMSKPFGLYYHRIGFLWSRDPVPSLYGNKWFKNVWSISIGAHVLRHYKATDLAEKYRSWQERACREASDILGIGIKPSDVWLLGHYYPNSEDSLPASISPFKRGLAYRFCLTPYYMSYVNE